MDNKKKQQSSILKYVKKYLISGTLLLILMAYTVVFSINQINQQKSHAISTGHDSAEYHQTMWNTAQGKLFHNTVNPHPCTKSYNQLGNHFGLIYLFLLPVYVLYPHHETMAILQTIFIAAGGWALYLLCRLICRDKLVGLLVALGFISAPMTIRMFYWGIRPIYFSAAPFVLAIYFIFQNKVFLYAFFLLLAIICKENVSLLGIPLGLLILFNQRIKHRKLIGLATISFSLSYFLIITRYVMPSIWIGDYRWDVLSGESSLFSIERLEEISRSVYQFNKLEELGTMFGPMTVLPLLSPAAMLVMPGVAQFIIFNLTWNVWNIMLLLPAIYVAAIFGAKTIQDKIPGIYKSVSPILIISIIVFNIIPFPKFFHWFTPDDINLYLFELKEKHIPDNASLITQMHLLPSFSSRPELYWLDFKDILNAKDFEKKQTDYLFFGVHRAYSEHGPRELVSLLNFIDRSKRYKLLVADRGYLVFQRKDLAPYEIDDMAQRKLARNWLMQVLSRYNL